jgi:predicted DNA-binding protein (UPF0251 family)
VSPEQFCYWLQGVLVGSRELEAGYRASVLDEVETKLESVFEQLRLKDCTQVWVEKEESSEEVSQRLQKLLDSRSKTLAEVLARQPFPAEIKGLSVGGSNRD